MPGNGRGYRLRIPERAQDLHIDLKDGTTEGASYNCYSMAHRWAFLPAEAKSVRRQILHASPTVRPPGDTPPLPLPKMWAACDRSSCQFRFRASRLRKVAEGRRARVEVTHRLGTPHRKGADLKNGPWPQEKTSCVPASSFCLPLFVFASPPFDSLYGDLSTRSINTRKPKTSARCCGKT